MSIEKWLEVGPGVFQRRYDPLDVSVGAVVGPHGVTIIDTRNNPAEAREIIRDAKRRFGQPIVAAVNTHAHYDHTFGNQVFAQAGIPIYGHYLVPRHFEQYEKPHLQRIQAQPELEPDKSWDAVELTAPTALLDSTQRVQLGGREIELVPLEPGHTDTDLAVFIPDAGVWFLGDIVEESGPPMFGSGSYPLGWPPVLQSLLERIQETDAVVPGHGSVVDREFVAAQAAKFSGLAEVLSQAHASGTPPGDIEYSRDLRSYWPADFLRSAADDAYRQLAEP